MAITNEPEKRKLSEYYSDKVSALHRSLGLLKDSAESATDPDRSRQLRFKLTSGYRSKLPALYTNIKKNADSVVKLGPTVFPDIRCSYDDSTGRHTFTNCPNFTNLFNEYRPALAALVSMPAKSTSPDGKRGTRETTPCFITPKEGMSLTAFLKSKRPSDDLRSMQIINFSEPNAIHHCEQEQCLDCVDCAPHQTELRNALVGSLSADPNTGDGMRQVHMKNLMTVLNSWAAHSDTRGRDMNSQSDVRYKADAYDHNLFGSTLRVMAHRLNLAYEDDRKANPGMGGGIHRDHFGIGDDPRVY